ncbi:SprB repeat-containing protein [Membranihabitans marinus]|uniref:SprB repeat-containing protein n=1 Tax=Membranihabitans marinus TaxID=1227546 RepID=UPI001F372D3D|nr:SprB repeat-containing protein [Membranihabitans marinus]
MFFSLLLLFAIGPAMVNGQDCSDIIFYTPSINSEVIQNGVVYKRIQFHISHASNTDPNAFYFLLVDGAVEDINTNDYPYGSRTPGILVPVDADTIYIQDGSDLSCRKQVILNLEADKCSFNTHVNSILNGSDCSDVTIEISVGDTIELDTIAWYKDGDESVVVHDELIYVRPEPGSYKLLLSDTAGCEAIIDFPTVACPHSNAGDDFPIAHCIDEGLPLNLWEHLASTVDLGQFYDNNFNSIDSIDARQINYGSNGIHTYYYISQTPSLGRDTAEITVDAYTGRCRSCVFELANPVMTCVADSQYIDFEIRGGDGIMDTAYQVVFPDGLDTVLKYNETFRYFNTLYDAPLLIQLQSVARTSCDSTMNLGIFPSCNISKCGFEVFSAVDTNLCFDGNEGGIGLTISKGTGPFTVDWSTGDSGEVLQHLASGDYEAYITDGVGCIDTFEFRVGGPSQANELKILLDESSQDSVSITIGVQQGMGTFDILAQLDLQSANFTATRGIDQTVTFEQTKDTALVSMTDINGCVVDTTIILTPNCITPIIQQTNLTCGFENGSIQIEVPDDIMLRSTITWDDISGNGYWDRSDLALGDYHYTIDYDRCSIPGTVSMAEDIYTPVNISIFNNCELDGIVTYYVADSAQLINWMIDDEILPYFSIDLPTNQAFEFITESTEGCLDTVNLNTSEEEWLKKLAYRTDNTLEATLNIDPMGYLNFGWRTDDEMLCSACLEYGSTEIIQSGVYKYFVEQYPGCYADTSLSLRQDNQYFEMPNVITPEGIQNNFVQIFDPYKQMASIMEFNVFDRYGNLLFFKNDFMPNSEDQLNWPASYTELPDIIVCVAKIKCVNDDEVTLTQSVLVLR